MYMYIYIYIYTYIYFILCCNSTGVQKTSSQGGPCRKKMQVTFMYLSTRSQKTNFPQRCFGWPFTKTNTIQTSSTWPINKNSLEGLNRVVTLYNRKIHDRMTVHRNRFRANKTNRCTEFQFYWYYYSTCFGQPFCPSSGVVSCISALVYFMQLWPFAARSRME